MWPKKNKISAPSQTVATARIAPKVCHGQPPTFVLQSSKFHPNRFTFGGVIAGRVKAVKMRRKVSPSTRRSYSFSPSKKSGPIITHWPLPPCQISLKSKKLFVDDRVRPALLGRLWKRVHLKTEWTDCLACSQWRERRAAAHCRHRQCEDGCFGCLLADVPAIDASDNNKHQFKTMVVFLWQRIGIVL